MSKRDSSARTSDASARPQPSQPADRRRSARVEILDRLHGHLVGLNVSVTVQEMGLGGMAIETPFAFPVGALHEFKLTMGDGSFVMLRGIVKHCRDFSAPGDPSLFVTGFAFVDEAAATEGPTVGEIIEKLGSDEP